MYFVYSIRRMRLFTCQVIEASSEEIVRPRRRRNGDPDRRVVRNRSASPVDYKICGNCHRAGLQEMCNRSRGRRPCDPCVLQKKDRCYDEDDPQDQATVRDEAARYQSEMDSQMLDDDPDGPVWVPAPPVTRSDASFEAALENAMMGSNSGASAHPTQLDVWGNQQLRPANSTNAFARPTVTPSPGPGADPMFWDASPPLSRSAAMPGVIQPAQAGGIGLNALTDVGAQTGLHRGFGGNEESRPEQDLENASLAWVNNSDLSMIDPATHNSAPNAPFVPDTPPEAKALNRAVEFLASKYNNAGDVGDRAIYTEFNRKKTTRNIGNAVLFDPIIVTQLGLSARATLRWEDAPEDLAKEGPSPLGLFPSIPKIRSYLVNANTSVSEGFEADAKVYCDEYVPAFARPGVEVQECPDNGNAKACDRLGHDPRWGTCKPCHQEQNQWSNNLEGEPELLDQLRIYLCKPCTRQLIPGLGSIGWCVCADQLKTAWLCHNELLRRRRPYAIILLSCASMS